MKTLKAYRHGGKYRKRGTGTLTPGGYLMIVKNKEMKFQHRRIMEKTGIPIPNPEPFNLPTLTLDEYGYLVKSQNEKYSRMKAKKIKIPSREDSVKVNHLYI